MKDDYVSKVFEGFGWTEYDQDKAKSPKITRKRDLDKEIEGLRTQLYSMGHGSDVDKARTMYADKGNYGKYLEYSFLKTKCVKLGGK